jgi:hypothetical protein
MDDESKSQNDGDRRKTDRRIADDPDYKGPERRSGTDRRDGDERRGGVDRRKRG